MMLVSEGGGEKGGEWACKALEHARHGAPWACVRATWAYAGGTLMSASKLLAHALAR